MTINRKVLDLSHHNTITNYQAIKDAGIVGVIHKATEGTGYIDPNYTGRMHDCLEHNLLWGAYHFMHPGNISEQLSFFLAKAGMDDRFLYALDWEASSTGTASMNNAVEFMQLLEAKTGRKGVVYSGNVAKEQITGINSYLGSHRLWLAQYSATPKVQPSWRTWWLWQYSDGEYGPAPHGCPGVTGLVDTNTWAGTDDELRAQWSGMGAIVPPVELPTVTITVKSSTPIKLVVVQE